MIQDQNPRMPCAIIIREVVQQLGVVDNHLNITLRLPVEHYDAGMWQTPNAAEGCGRSALPNWLTIQICALPRLVKTHHVNPWGFWGKAKEQVFTNSGLGALGYSSSKTTRTDDLLPDIISGADQPKQQIRNVTVVIRAARWI
jgi:hypothetical protein